MGHKQQLNFESIRPYEDHEVQTVFNRLKNEESFLRLIGFLYPDSPPTLFLDSLKNVSTIRQFQEEVISAYVIDIIDIIVIGKRIDDEVYLEAEKRLNNEI